jgi:hypothetical protein
MRVVEEANPWPLGLGRLVHRSRRLVKDPKMPILTVGFGRSVHRSRGLPKDRKRGVETNPDGWIRKIGASQPSLGQGPNEDARRRNQSWRLDSEDRCIAAVAWTRTH